MCLQSEECYPTASLCALNPILHVFKLNLGFRILLVGHHHNIFDTAKLGIFSLMRLYQDLIAR